MMLTPPAPWLTKRSTAVAGTVTLAIAVAVVVSVLQQPRYEQAFAGVPLPFFSNIGSDFAGDINFYDRRNGIDIYEVTFLQGETSEIFENNAVYLARIPANNASVRNVPMDEVFRTLSGGEDVDYFGYRYVTSNAIYEVTARHDPDFADRFPGWFFASAEAWAMDPQRGDMIAEFQASHGITFLATDGSVPAVSIAEDSLYVFVVNQPGGARFTPMQSPLCGNGNLDAGEDCDDGNQNDADVCSNGCYYNVPIPFGSGGEVLSIQVQTIADTATAEYGETDIPLLRFQADASDDVTLDQLILNAEAGNLLSAENYTLWRDTDSDGIVDLLVQGGIDSLTGLVTFTPTTNNVIANSATVIFEIHADVTSAPSSSTLQIRLATLEPDYVTGTRVGDTALVGIETDGSCNDPICEIIVTTDTSTLWTLEPPPASSSASASSGSGASSSSVFSGSGSSSSITSSESSVSSGSGSSSSDSSTGGASSSLTSSDASSSSVSLSSSEGSASSTSESSSSIASSEPPASSSSISSSEPPPSSSSSSSSAPACNHNGIVEPPEECDDGNFIDNDSCDNNCQLPPIPPAP